LRAAYVGLAEGDSGAKSIAFLAAATGSRVAFAEAEELAAGDAELFGGFADVAGAGGDGGLDDLTGEGWLGGWVGEDLGE